MLSVLINTHLEGMESVLERSMAVRRCHLADYQKTKMREVYFASLAAHYRNYVARGKLSEIPHQYIYDTKDEEAALDDPWEVHFEELFEETGNMADYVATKQIVATIKERKNIDVPVVTVGRYISSKISKGSKIRRARSSAQRGFQGLRPTTTYGSIRRLGSPICNPQALSSLDCQHLFAA